MPLSVTAFASLLDTLSASATCSAHTIGDNTHSVSYRDLLAYADKLETRLQVLGIHPDDCIAFECENTTASLLLMLTLFYRGQHLLLLPPQDSPLKAPGFKPDIPAFCKSHLTISESADPATTIAPGNITQWLHTYPNPQFSPHTYERLAISAQERLVMMRTSGSTGDAKIIRFSHEKLLRNAANCTERFGLTAESRVTIAVPVYHMFGLGAGFVPALLAGAAINVQANTNILRFLEAERQFAPDTVYLNPTLATMLLKRRQQHQYRRTVSAGAALPEQVMTEYRERFGPMTNLYGSTEMGAAATTVDTFADSQPNYLLPMPGVEMQINPETRELHCLHPAGFDGYLNSQGEKLPTLVAPYNTGDIAQHMADGRIELLGRQCDSTNRAGFLVHFKDIEEALLRTGEVEQAIVLNGRQETIRGQKIYAFCIASKTAANPHTINNETIRRACFEQLPRYAIPDEIILKETFPLAHSGKVNRLLLQQHIPE